MNPFYDEALDARTDALGEIQRHIEGRIASFTEHSFATSGEMPTTKEVENMVLQEAYMLRLAQVYVWPDRDITRAVLHSADSLPVDVPFHRAWLHGPAGFWWLGANSPLVVKSGRDANGDIALTSAGLALEGLRQGVDFETEPAGAPYPNPDRRICALAWLIREDENDIIYTAYSLDESRGVPYPIFGETWKEGRSLTEQVAYLSSFADTPGERAGLAAVRKREPTLADAIERHQQWYRESSAAISRFWVAANLWLNQRILRSEPGDGISRATRKRALRVQLDPTVRVVHLRAAEQRHPVSVDSPEGREYHCRWIVHGHWRNQWYPSQGCHIPKWIKVHVKGQPGAPFKEPTTMIFSVDR